MQEPVGNLWVAEIPLTQQTGDDVGNAERQSDVVDRGGIDGNLLPDATLHQSARESTND
jgi:hypothetical protein